MRGRGSELYRIREYTSEDSARHIDWKATAKSGSVKVREFTREEECKVCIIFDNPGKGVLSGDSYEEAINLVASLSWHLTHGNMQISFISQDYPNNSDVYAFLQHLAVIQAGSNQAVIETLRNTQDFNIIITAIPVESIPGHLLQNAHVIPLQ